jgi:mRNA-degrading endonuclease RelE of RelBE toxin-antitoxin system
MSYNVIPSDKFKKEAKRLIRKFPSLKEELRELNITLCERPETGKPLGKNIYKIRLSIKSKGKGKSGGARVITYLITENEEIYLLIIYDKLLQQIIDGLNIDRIDRT